MLSPLLYLIFDQALPLEMDGRATLAPRGKGTTRRRAMHPGLAFEENACASLLWMCSRRQRRATAAV